MQGEEGGGDRRRLDEEVLALQQEDLEEVQRVLRRLLVRQGLSGGRVGRSQTGRSVELYKITDPHFLGDRGLFIDLDLLCDLLILESYPFMILI